MGTSIILITHDLGVVAETAPTRDGHVLPARPSSAARVTNCSKIPLHPYT